MKLTKKVLTETMEHLRKNVLGKKVTYCRAKPLESGAPDLFRGAGIITGIIIGTSKRVQLLIQDESENKDKAWTLDELCVLPSDADAEAYFEHYKKIRALVDEHNEAQKLREKEKIKEVDDFNAALFGGPLEMEK